MIKHEWEKREIKVRARLENEIQKLKKRAGDIQDQIENLETSLDSVNRELSKLIDELDELDRDHE